MTTVRFPRSVIYLAGALVVAWSHVATAQPVRTTGAGVEVGAVRLHVQIVQQRVVVQEVRGANGAALPSTDVIAQFGSWEPSTRTVTINVGVRNIGTVSLFQPITAVVTGLASPLTTAANADAGTGVGSWGWTYHGPPLAAGAPSAVKAWQFVSPTAMDFQAMVRISAGVPLPAGVGGTVTSVDGSAVTVPPDAIPFEALVDVKQVPTAVLPPSSSNLPVVGAVALTIESAEQFTDVQPLAVPLTLTIPAPANPGA